MNVRISFTHTLALHQFRWLFHSLAEIAARHAGIRILHTHLHTSQKSQFRQVWVSYNFQPRSSSDQLYYYSSLDPILAFSNFEAARRGIQTIREDVILQNLGLSVEESEGENRWSSLLDLKSQQGLSTNSLDLIANLGERDFARNEGRIEMEVPHGKLADIRHRTVKVNGISMHIVEQGQGPLVLLLHGFPEFWYSWRYQIPALAEAGYHVVAPDLRGYGQSDAPRSSSLYTSFHLVGDLVALLDVLEEKQAFVVGHDWGAMVAWDLCLLRPDCVKAVVCLSVPFFPRLSKGSAIKGYYDTLGEGFYMCRFQKPGRAERDFARIGTTATLSKILFPPRNRFTAPRDKELMDSIPMPKKLPAWISDADLGYYAQTYEKSGWTGALNLYRAMEKSWELKAPWTNVGVKTTALFIAGDKDLVMGFPGVKSYVSSNFKSFVPNLKEIVTLKGGHFIQQEQPDRVNELILTFLHEQTLASSSRL